VGNFTLACLHVNTRGITNVKSFTLQATWEEERKTLKKSFFSKNSHFLHLATKKRGAATLSITTFNIMTFTEVILSAMTMNILTFSTKSSSAILSINDT
jgi:hypothetical protein